MTDKQYAKESEFQHDLMAADMLADPEERLVATLELLERVSVEAKMTGLAQHAEQSIFGITGSLYTTPEVTAFIDSLMADGDEAPSAT